MDSPTGPSTSLTDSQDNVHTSVSLSTEHADTPTEVGAVTPTPPLPSLHHTAEEKPLFIPAPHNSFRIWKMEFIDSDESSATPSTKFVDKALNEILGRNDPIGGRNQFAPGSRSHTVALESKATEDTTEIYRDPPASSEAMPPKAGIFQSKKRISERGLGEMTSGLFQREYSGPPTNTTAGNVLSPYPQQTCNTLETFDAMNASPYRSNAPHLGYTEDTEKRVGAESVEAPQVTPSLFTSIRIPIQIEITPSLVRRHTHGLNDDLDGHSAALKSTLPRSFQRSRTVEGLPGQNSITSMAAADAPSLMESKNDAKGTTKSETKNEIMSKNSTVESAYPQFKNRWEQLIDAFLKQRWMVWQPILTPCIVISYLTLMGVVYLILGVFLLAEYNSIAECRKTYRDPTPMKDGETDTTLLTLSAADCTGLTDSDTITNSNIYLYYELTSFYQNHRRYAKSFSSSQLSGEVFVSESSVSSCAPLISRKARVLHPCGLIPWSAFNDSFSLWTDEDLSTPIALDESAETIALHSDIRYRYKNPDKSNMSDEELRKVDFWMESEPIKEVFPKGIEDPHFMVWMRLAAGPDFRKLYGRINYPFIQLPITVAVKNRYPVEAFGGTKSIVITVSHALGGRNLFLSITYIVFAVICLLTACYFYYENTRKPRVFGDVRLLNSASND